MQTVIKFEFISSQSLVNCFCAKETHSVNPLFLFCNSLTEGLILSAAHAFFCSRWRACHYCGVQIFGFHVVASSICGQNDRLPCKLDFHSLCGSHFGLLDKKQLCHHVHHRASTEILILLAQSQLIKSNCVNNTTVLQIRCFVESWLPTTGTKVVEQHVVQ